MTAIDTALDMIRRFEGCKLKAYRDIVGVLTIGYGETLGVKEGDVWTQEQADSILRSRVAQFLLAVHKKIPGIDGNRLAACTSLAYNIGIGAFKASSVCRHAMRGDHDKAAQSFLLWDKAGGRKIKGLTIRRELERLKYVEAWPK